MFISFERIENKIKKINLYLIIIIIVAQFEMDHYIYQLILRNYEFFQLWFNVYDLYLCVLFYYVNIFNFGNFD